MKISAVRYHGLDRWRVNWRERGKTLRRFFPTKKAAEVFATETASALKEYGEAWNAIPSAGRAELIGCWIRSKERGYSIGEACRHFEAVSTKLVGLITLSELCRRCIAAKRSKNLRKESLRVLSVTLNHFMLGREEQPASSISAEEITDWLDRQANWGQWRRRGAIIDLTSLYSWGVKAKLVTSNPMESIDRPMIDREAPSVLTVEQCRSLLKLCRRKEYRKLLPWLVISLFAGIRQGEIERLHWGAIADGHIALSTHQTKGRARRLVTVRPTLKAWLETLPKAAGLVCPGSHRKLALKFRAEAGGLPRNVLRHSFISYALGASETVDRVAMESGNTPEIIFEHYREIVKPKDAEEFWGLLPNLKVQWLPAHCEVNC